MTFVFNPVHDLLRSSEELQQEINKLFSRNGNSAQNDGVWTPSAEVTENEQAFEVEVDLPGLTKDDVKISVEKNVLVISGQRKMQGKSLASENSKFYHHNERLYGSFRRSFTLSDRIKAEEIDALYENGVLRLTLPKAEEAKPRSIEIKAK